MNSSLDMSTCNTTISSKISHNIIILHKQIGHLNFFTIQKMNLSGCLNDFYVANSKVLNIICKGVCLASNTNFFTKVIQRRHMILYHGILFMVIHLQG